MNEPESSEDNENNAVEECPPPPAYYKQISILNISPPVLSSSETTIWSSEQQYNGSIGAQINSQNVAIVLNEDYKTEMKSTLSGILSSGLLVVSDDCSHHQSAQIEERIAPLVEAIQKMQSIIGTYQPHEARELLCLDMASQVQRLRDIKSEMTVLLEMGKKSDRNPL
mmetsp:Transcript_22618/g.21837  ORF Transcript_22618/g.21837 Transcript_22618/m.21837 type:complete len:168 (+) Transcript_22618:92-595(+)|eukprot:CAMPEP_0119036950 /NCGR_PEP_ID=MMETSP1177-20130426/4990_1 /TAXON_ID=2985 /ORGANISM="Ochromonas sp, Strain CCMP1899" /LENGTH=167 /DNA_ID=CAMNT_0006997509 /DNA_START=66 /DNA_END=569 /DNA_ORIENTATION=+